MASASSRSPLPPSLMCCKALGHSTARVYNSSASGIGPSAAPGLLAGTDLTAHSNCLPGVYVLVLAISLTGTAQTGKSAAAHPVCPEGLNFSPAYQ